MAIFLSACLILLFVLSGYRRKSRFAMLLLQVLPFLFVFVFLWLARNHYEIIQIQKIGYEFEKVTHDYRHPARSVTIGGDQQKDELYAAELPPSAVRITPSLSDGSSQLQVLSDGVMILQNQQPLNVISLKDGDRISIGNHELIFHAKGAFDRSFQINNKTWQWPRKISSNKKIKQPDFTEGFTSQIYSLDEIGETLGVSLDSRSAVFLERLHFSRGRRPLQINSVNLIFGPDTAVNAIAPPDHSTLHDGDSLKVCSIQKLDTGVRLHATFDFIVKNGETLTFLHGNPPTIGMKEALLRSGETINKPLLITTTTLPYSAFPTIHYSEESKTFSSLSAFVQLQRGAAPKDFLDAMRQRFLTFFAMQPRTAEVMTDDGVYHPRDGQPFELGKAEKILFALNQVHFPWKLLQVLLILFLVKILFQPPFFSAIENPTAQWILISIDFFLATRFLFAFRAASLFPFSFESIDLSLLAILIVPYLVFVACLFHRDNLQRPHSTNFVTYSLVVLLVAWLLLPQHIWLMFFVVLLSAGVAFVKFHPRSFWPRLQGSIESLRTLNTEMYLLLIIAVALILRFFGLREAIWIGSTRIPLVFIYHPLFLLLSCKYLFHLNRIVQEEKTPETLKATVGLLLKSFLLFGTFLFISFLMADLGFFLLYCLPVLFLLFGSGAVLISQYELRWKAAGLLAAAPLFILFLALFSTSTVDRLLPHSYFDNRYVQRILLAVDPSALEESGLIAAERQLGHQRTFLAYSHSGLSGAGYMERPVSAALSATALNDNVPSVFLLNDFGILGFAGVVLILLLWALLWMQSAPPGSYSYARILSFAALVTIIFVDLYMILSNCGVFLFTGKNVFLWGLNSTSDLFHSSLLFCFLLVPLTAMPVAEVEPAKLELPMTFVAELPSV